MASPILQFEFKWNGRLVTCLIDPFFLQVIPVVEACTKKEILYKSLFFRKSVCEVSVKSVKFQTLIISGAGIDRSLTHTDVRKRETENTKHETRRPLSIG